MDYTVKPLREHLVDLGKARIFYAVNGPLEADVTPVQWDGSGELYLKELALTEGDMNLAPNPEYSDLKLQDYTGPAILKRYLTGEAPVLTVGMYLADPALLSVISPTGSSGVGFESYQPVQLLTLVLIPENAFRTGIGQPFKPLTYTGGEWLLDGDPYPESQDRFLGNTTWMWAVAPTRPPRTFANQNGLGALSQAEFALIQDIYGLPFLPEGAQTYWIGANPATVGIDIEGGS